MTNIQFYKGSIDAPGCISNAWNLVKVNYGLYFGICLVATLTMIILSCIVYGMAFDFFNISGSLFVETETDSSIRSSAQGLFMMMTNGVGAFLGSKISGYVIDTYYTSPEGDKNWHSIWLAFAGYALVVAVLFLVLFRYKHNPQALDIKPH